MIFSNEEKPSLRELQSWMRWLFTEPQGVSAALQKISSDPRESGARCLRSIAQTPPLARERRLDIYAEAYFSRLSELMADDFRGVNRIVGESVFRGMVSGYLQTHPSRSFQISEVGRYFSDYLRSHPLADALEFLPELASLEWLLIESFYSEERPPLDPSVLHSMSPDQWATRVVALDPAVRLLKTGWNVEVLLKDEIDTAGGLGGAESTGSTITEKAVPGDRRLVVFRHDLNVQIREVSPQEFKVLDLLKEALTLDELCGRLEEEFDGEEVPFSEWFQKWTAWGLLRA